MRNVVLLMTASIDGFVVGPEEHAGGLPEPEELKRWKLDRIRSAGTHIMGRVTYEEMASFWPTSTDDYAAPMNEIPKVVFSKTLESATWPESSVARGDLVDEIAALRNEPGGDIIAWGGASFVQALSRARLIDEYAIVTQPVAYGGGLALFGSLPDALHLQLVATTTYPSGTALHIYEPRAEHQHPRAKREARRRTRHANNFVVPTRRNRVQNKVLRLGVDRVNERAELRRSPRTTALPFRTNFDSVGSVEAAIGCRRARSFIGRVVTTMSDQRRREANMPASVQILRLVTNPERVEASDPFHFMVELTNQGDETSGAFPVRFELDGGADAVEVHSPDVAPGATEWAYWAHGGLREGNHSIYCRLDPSHTVLRDGGPHHEQTIYFQIHEIEFAPQDPSGKADFDEDALANAVADAILIRIGQWVQAGDHAVEQWKRAADARVKDYVDAHTAPTLELNPFVEAIGEVILNHLPVVSEAKEMTEKVMAEFNIGALIRAGLTGTYNTVNTAHERLSQAVEEIKSATGDAIHKSVLGADGRVREYLSFKPNDRNSPLIAVESGSLDPAYIGMLAEWLGVPAPTEANTTQPIQDGMTHEFEVVLAEVDRQLRAATS